MGSNDSLSPQNEVTITLKSFYDLSISPLEFTTYACIYIRKCTCTWGGGGGGGGLGIATPPPPFVQNTFFFARADSTPSHPLVESAESCNP